MAELGIKGPLEILQVHVAYLPCFFTFICMIRIVCKINFFWVNMQMQVYVFIYSVFNCNTKIKKFFWLICLPYSV